VHYSAIALHSSLPDARESGDLTFTPTALTFTHAGGVITLPLDQTSMRLGGSADRLVFFESDTWPEGSIYTADLNVLRDPALTSHPRHAASVKRIGGERVRGKAIAVGCVLAVILGIASLFWFRAPLVAVVARGVPISVERKMGDLAMQQIALGASRIEDPRVLQPLRALVGELDEVAEGEYEFQIHVIDDPSVNAFALPGGQIAIHRGLLMEVESGEEIAGVVAHEMAHVTEQHSLRQMISTIGLFALVQALFGDVSGLLAAAAEGGAQLAALGFSRDAEREADRVGLQMLRRARYDPDGMLSFFQKMQSIERARGVAGEAAEELAFLSTHPATSERIANLQELTAENSVMEPRRVDIDIAALKKALEERHEVKR
jgi:Zn-dependent protease with chaperone function